MPKNLTTAEQAAFKSGYAAALEDIQAATQIVARVSQTNSPTSS